MRRIECGSEGGFTGLSPILCGETIAKEEALAWKIYNRNVRRLTSFVAIIILLSAAVPLLACVTGSAMNQEESACCRAMHGNCGDMAKMDCCRINAGMDEHPQIASIAPVVDAQFAVLSWLPLVLPEGQTVSPFRLSIPEEHSPPGLATARTIVLRI